MIALLRGITVIVSVVMFVITGENGLSGLENVISVEIEVGIRICHCW